MAPLVDEATDLVMRPRMHLAEEKKNLSTIRSSLRPGNNNKIGRKLSDGLEVKTDPRPANGKEEG